ncbi:MAG: hypothetical protein ACTSR2_04405 [Candidatus Hodarchaeales archaeon]
MNLNYTPCAYHPDKVAATKCERCNRPICLEDKRIYEESRYRRIGKHRRRYVVLMIIVSYVMQLNWKETAKEE